MTGPGFQMSFAATAALVALAEIWPRPVKEIEVPWPIRLVQGAVTWTAASIAVSFVAGLATGPFAIQHFNRVSTWGLFANLAVAPISSFLMMPGLALGAALTPLGLGQAPLEVAGWSIGLMNRIAATAAGAPASQIVVASAPDWVLPVSFLGLLFVCLWRGALRWAGLPLALAILWAPRPAAPDVWVSADGAAVAVREGREAVLLRPDVKLFGAEPVVATPWADAPDQRGRAGRAVRLRPLELCARSQGAGPARGSLEPQATLEAWAAGRALRGCGGGDPAQRRPTGKLRGARWC